MVRPVSAIFACARRLGVDGLLEARDSLLKQLYTRVFEHVVHAINDSLSGGAHRMRSPWVAL